MKLKTFLIVGCLGGLFTLSSCTAPTNVKDVYKRQVYAQDSDGIAGI